jgi:hypothetical protein
MKNKPQYSAVGAIIPDALYRLDEAKARMGWRDASFREARRAGLKTYRAGKRLYLLGSDIIDFVTSRKGEKMHAETRHTYIPQPEKEQTS